MGGARVLSGCFGGLEAEMVVAVAELGFAAWVDDVYLGCQLVGRSQV